jgi:hypothetical protein
MGFDIEELRDAIRTQVLTDDILEQLVNFMWEFDPYGILDHYGHIDDEGVKEQLLEEAQYRFENEPEVVLDELDFYESDGAI